VVAVGLLAAVFGWLSPLRRLEGRPGSDLTPDVSTAQARL
jgi:hypothetical protein